MEIILNVAWAVLAFLSVLVWLRFEERKGSERRLPMIALAVLLVILFPVISVSDDLWSVQNPAESDTCSRRNQIAPWTPAAHSPLVALPVLLFVQAATETWAYRAPAQLPLGRFSLPPLSYVENRPPPVA